MQYVSIHEVKTHLSRLLKKIEAGEELMITNNGRPVATITAPKLKKRISGDMIGKGMIVPDNFDDPMPDEWFDSKDEDAFYKP